MLNKNPDAVSAAALKGKRVRRKTPIRAAAAATAVINEPQADWVPLLYAPFYYGSSGYIRTTEEWREYLRARVARCLPESFRSDLKWSIETNDTRVHRIARVKAMGMVTLIAPGGLISIEQDDDELLMPRYYVGDPQDFINRFDRGELEMFQLPPKLQGAASWHKQILSDILDFSQVDFGNAITSGAAHIVARKNTILAPFERVTWDQWRYFRLDNDEPPRRGFAWHDPEWSFVDSLDRWPRSTATGPAGEKLYAIHVAPGVVAESGGRPADKCLQWLLQLLRKYPERQPKPISKLADEAMAMFPGLSKRAFDRCVTVAKALTGRPEWSKRGPPPKSSQ
jgi:hypothetical protein